MIRESCSSLIDYVSAHIYVSMSIRKMTQTVERCFTESISNKSNKNKSIVNRICAIRVNDARKEYVAWLMAKMRIPALSERRAGDAGRHAHSPIGLRRRESLDRDCLLRKARGDFIYIKYIIINIHKNL